MAQRQWCWDSGTGLKGDPRIWKPYTADVQKKIEDGFTRKIFEVRSVRIGGRYYDMEFHHYDKTDLRRVIGRQHSNTGVRFFHFVSPGRDTHITRTSATTTGQAGTGATSSRPVWCWNSGTAHQPEWTAYTSDLQSQIQRIDDSRSRRGYIFIKGSEYEIDTYDMVQQHSTRGNTRKIKKTIPTSSGPSSSSTSSATRPVSAVTVPIPASTGTTSSNSTTAPKVPAGDSSKVTWQWNSGTGDFPNWKPYDAAAEKVIEASYQKYIVNGQRFSDCIIDVTASNGFKFKIDFERMNQSTSRGSRKIRRREVGGGKVHGNGGSMAMVLGTDGDIKSTPTKVATKLQVGTIVEFSVRKVSRLTGREFLQKTKGKVLGADPKNPSIVLAKSMKDGDTYKLKPKSFKTIPVFSVGDIPAWQIGPVTPVAAPKVTASALPIECNLRTTVKYRDPVYRDIVTKNMDRTAPCDEIETTLSSVTVGQKVRALWKLSDYKAFPGKITALKGSNHASVLYNDGDKKDNCPLKWIMPEVRKPFDPSKATVGQSVLLRPRNSKSKFAREIWEEGKFISAIMPPKVPAGPSAAANRIVRLWRGDVTHLSVDAVQNAANARLSNGGGLCGAIHDAAGPQLSAACKKIPVIHKKSVYAYDDAIFGGRADDSFGTGDRCDEGDTKVTPAFNLPAKYVLHTVGPQGVKPKELRSAYLSALNEATKVGARSIALCCISTGIYGYPLQQATPVALSAVREWLDNPKNAGKVDAIIFCVFQEQELAVYRHWFPLFFSSGS